MLRQAGRREGGRTARDAPRPGCSERGTERPRSPAERSARLRPKRGRQRPPRRRLLIGRRGGGRGAHWPAARGAGGARGGSAERGNSWSAAAPRSPALQPGPAAAGAAAPATRRDPQRAARGGPGLTNFVAPLQCRPGPAAGSSRWRHSERDGGREGCASPLSHIAIKTELERCPRWKAIH